MTELISIKRYADGDRQALERLVGKMYDFEFAIAPGRQCWKEAHAEFCEWFDKLLNDKDGFVFVATLNADVVGVCIGHLEVMNYPALKPERPFRKFLNQMNRL